MPTQAAQQRESGETLLIGPTGKCEPPRYFGGCSSAAAVPRFANGDTYDRRQSSAFARPDAAHIYAG
jgi:hypothetical protein